MPVENLIIYLSMNTKQSMFTENNLIQYLTRWNCMQVTKISELGNIYVKNLYRPKIFQ